AVGGTTRAVALPVRGFAARRGVVVQEDLYFFLIKSTKNQGLCQPSLKGGGPTRNKKNALRSNSFLFYRYGPAPLPGASLPRPGGN
ncbi:MAG: hypothetical protein ACK51A_12030, partial [Sphingobacteriia bacterium]